MLDRMKQKVRKFQDFIRYSFNDEELLTQSLTTPRLSNEIGTASYEFLETLGDAVIKIIFILKLYNLGIKDPGEITKIKATLESDKALRSVAKNMDLQDYIFKTEKQTVKGTRILADVFEAICGAMFFDSNYDFQLVEEKMINPFYGNIDLTIENARLHHQIEEQLKTIAAKAAHRINNKIEMSLKIELN